MFAKFLRKENPDQSYSAADTRSAWSKASQETKAFCSKKAAEWTQQGPFLPEEIHKALLSTAVSVSWTQLATLVSGTGNLEMISEKSIWFALVGWCRQRGTLTGVFTGTMAWTKIILGLMPLLLHMLPQILAHSMKAKQSIVDYVNMF